MHKNQNGIAHVLLVILILVVTGVVAFAGYKVYQNQSDKAPDSSNAGTGTSTQEVNPNEPPLKLKSIGINLDYYDANTNKAGDVMFTKTGLESYGDILFFDFGLVFEANSAAERRQNPQPTFIVPLGTKIQSLVDGTVVNVEKLYSDDYTIMVATDKESEWMYETEHVLNPLVKVGDKVTAGQVIAEASDHDSQYHPGYGLYEIGILRGGNPPEHVCPFNYLDDSIKQDTFDKLTALYKSWEEYMGDTKLYDESKLAVPGCLTLEPVEG